MVEASLSHQDEPAMSARRVFQLLSSAAKEGTTSARVGKLTLPGRRPIETPNFTTTTSRGVVPHLTPDNVEKCPSLSSSYMALEDFIERKNPPIYSTPECEKPRLHAFTGMPIDRTTILAPRRCPQVLAPTGNSDKYLHIFTSTGFAKLSVSQYVSAFKTLQPDIVLPLADSLHKVAAPSSKKLIKLVERTEEWLDEFLESVKADDNVSESATPVIFAPVLSVEYPIQWNYLRYLSEDVLQALSGLAIYDVDILPEFIAYPGLTSLPRLSMEPPKSPHDLLRQVELGVDMCLVTFVNAMSDAGVALTFTFPAPPKGDASQPLGEDMWRPEHSKSLTPLSESCRCDVCSRHSRAYVHHLLNAREMLGWNLLQMHNHHVLSNFFAGIRASLAKGVTEFEKDAQLFSATYEHELPKGTGERPRARGYHFKSDHKQPKINRPGWGVIGGVEESASAADSVEGVVNSTPIHTQE